MAICQDPTGAAFGVWKAWIHSGATVTEDIGSMAWCELYSPDAKRARDFYSALLGTSSNPMPGPMEYYVLQHGEQQLAGIMQIDPAWGNMHPAWLVYFSVANTDATVAVITKHGGKVMGNQGYFVEPTVRPLDESGARGNLWASRLRAIFR